MMASMTGAVAVLVGLLLYMTILAFLIVYILGYVKGKKEGRKDPLLGSKVMLTFFMTICFQLILLALAVLLASSTMKHAPGKLAEILTGLMLGALVAGIYPSVMYLAVVRGRGAFKVGRKALGLNAVITGIVSTLGIIATFVMMLADAKVAEVLLFTFVYLAASLGCGIPLVISASREAAMNDAVD